MIQIAMRGIGWPGSFAAALAPGRPARHHEAQLSRAKNGVAKSSTWQRGRKTWWCDGEERVETMRFMIPDGIYYIVLADLAGSTSYMKKMGNDAGITRFRKFERAARQALEHSKSASLSNTGVVVKTIGDAVLLVFKHFPDIVQWDLEFDGVLNRIPNKAELMKARIWVHVGELRFEENDINGLAVNDLCKIEKKAKKNAEPHCLILTHLAKEIAAPALYPEYCALEACGSVRLEGASSVKLYRVANADLPFLLSKQLREKRQN